MPPVNFNVGNAGQQAQNPSGKPTVSQQPSMPQGQPPIPTGQPPVQQPSMPQGQPPIPQGIPQQQPLQSPQGMPAMPPQGASGQVPQQNIGVMQQPVPKQSNKNTKGKKGKGSGKKRGKKKKQDESIVMDRQYMEKQYKSYRTRKIGMFWGTVCVLVLIVGFGVINTFFQEKYTDGRAVQAVLAATHQGTSQQWDSGVEGFLQRNVKDLLTKYFKSSGQSKKFEVDNIAVECNLAKGNQLFLCFFSVDITALGGDTVRAYCMVPILTAGDGFHVAGDLIFSEKKPFSANGIDITPERAKDDTTTTAFLAFNEDSRDETAAKEFESTATNFFTLGYNDPRHDVSDIYKGEAQLNFQGHFENLVECSVYKEANELGFNAYVEYNISLSNGLFFTNHAYMKINKNSGGSYNIELIY